MQKMIWISAAIAAVAAGITIFYLRKKKTTKKANYTPYTKVPGQSGWEYTL